MPEDPHPTAKLEMTAYIHSHHVGTPKPELFYSGSYILIRVPSLLKLVYLPLSTRAKTLNFLNPEPCISQAFFSLLRRFHGASSPVATGAADTHMAEGPKGERQAPKFEGNRKVHRV